MPVKDRMASLRKTIVAEGESHVMSALIIPTEEEESTDEFLRRVTSVREAITEMEGVVDLIRQLHNLLKVSNNHQNVDRARLRILFEKLSTIIENFSKDLDRAVETVNRFHDEVRKASDKKSAYYRMRKDQTESLKQSLHSVLLRFRKEEVPFLQETGPITEKHLKNKVYSGEYNLKPTEGFNTLQVSGQERAAQQSDPSTRPLSRVMEIGDVEKGDAAGAMTVTADENATHPLEVTEIDEENQNSEEKAALQEIKQRNEDLRLLERAMWQVNTLHEHLNFIVHRQNSVMDRIDTNISQAVEYTTKVMKDTDEAVQLSQEARQKSMLVFFLIGVLLFVIFMMLFTFIRVWVYGVR
ncbi:SNARE domain protein [Ancylostoma caninum]|uniref:SNARE domain protein n=1 Tax=Ancylostoma caninum TaxID=29170 RepID=A0A368GEL5_ANCCA|nr:SNARE domain protein [Ancylostoma caninum]